MPTSQAIVPTEHASRYLQQLCKHWSHKFEVEFDPQSGRIEFPEGRRAVFRAEPGTLVLQAEGPDAGALPRFEGVIADHLKRFAFREELTIEWAPVAG